MRHVPILYETRNWVICSGSLNSFYLLQSMTTDFNDQFSYFDYFTILIKYCFCAVQFLEVSCDNTTPKYTILFF